MIVKDVNTKIVFYTEESRILYQSQFRQTMNIDTEIWQTVVTMPESLKQELLHYARYLRENYSKTMGMNC